MRRVIFVVGTFLTALSVSALLFGGGYLWRGEPEPSFPRCEGVTWEGFADSYVLDTAYVVDSQALRAGGVWLMEDQSLWVSTGISGTPAMDSRFFIRIHPGEPCILWNTSQGG